MAERPLVWLYIGELDHELLQVESLGTPDKYGGRWDARVRIVLPGSSAQYVDVAEHMLRMGYAKRYDGKGPRPKWEPARPYPLEALERDLPSSG